METTVKMIIMSHLSDVIEGLEDVRNAEANRHRINFIKYLTVNYTNTDEYVNADVVYNDFKTKYPNL